MKFVLTIIICSLCLRTPAQSGNDFRFTEYGSINYFEPEPGQYLISDKIFFDLSSYRLRPESYSVLDSIAQLLRFLPGCYIEISNHTDLRYSNEFSTDITAHRAWAVYAYLTDSCGLDSTLYQWRGYTDTKPLVLPYDVRLPNGDTLMAGTVINEPLVMKYKSDKDTWEFVHSLNRRTEFRITGFTIAYQSVHDCIGLNTMNFTHPDTGQYFYTTFFYNLEHDYRPETNECSERVITFIDEHPGFIFRIIFHTDQRDASERNKLLSERKAEEYFQYLIENGADSLQLEFTGAGESEPLQLLFDFTLPDGTIVPVGSVLTEEFIRQFTGQDYEILHQLNRRTEIRIITIRT